VDTDLRQAGIAANAAIPPATQSCLKRQTLFVRQNNDSLFILRRRVDLFQSIYGSYPYVAHLYHKQTKSVIYVWIILHGFQDLNSRIIELVNDKREWISNEAIVTNSKVGVHLKGLTKTTESLNNDSLYAAHYSIQPKALLSEPTCL
jgi:hypothetical protein